MTKCSQCERQAIFLWNNIPLCAHCYRTVIEAFQIQNDMLTDTLNWLAGVMEMRVGLPGALPRYPIAQPAVYQGGRSR